MKLRTALVLAGVLLGLPAQSSAQAAGLRPAPSVLFRDESGGRAEADSLNIPSTYWKEGALITGVAGAVFGAVFATAWCNEDGASSDDCGVGRTLLGAALFGVFAAIPGALIGGQFPKSE